MNGSNNMQKTLTEQEIDQFVISQANDESAWEEPIRVRRDATTSLSIPADLAARATFLAQLHRTKSLDEWLAHIIQERVELEEAAFLQAKQLLSV